MLLTACSSGTNSSAPIEQFESIAVPTTTYAGKFAVYTKVGGSSTSTLTEIDTGSDFFLIESSYVGSDIQMTNESITYTYDHGTNPRSGYLGYTSIVFVDESGLPIISTSNKVPVIVVADGVVGNQGNHAIMGLRMNSNVSVKLFLPYPYNQMFMVDAIHSQLVFGNFMTSNLKTFGQVQLAESACSNLGVNSSITNVTCWNDMAIPVAYDISGNPSGITIYNSLFDSGASSSFQSSPLPSWLVLSGSTIENKMTAKLGTSNGQYPIPLTSSISAFDTNFNGNIVNAGNQLFNFYKVLFDQKDGTIGLHD